MLVDDEFWKICLREFKSDKILSLKGYVSFLNVSIFVVLPILSLYFVYFSLAGSLALSVCAIFFWGSLFLFEFCLYTSFHNNNIASQLVLVWPFTPHPAFFVKFSCFCCWLIVIFARCLWGCLSVLLLCL